MVLLSSLGLLFVLEMAAGAAMNNRHTILASYHICNEVSSQLTARNNELLLHCCAVTKLVQQCTLILLILTVSYHNTATQHKKVPQCLKWQLALP